MQVTGSTDDFGMKAIALHSKTAAPYASSALHNLQYIPSGY